MKRQADTNPDLQGCPLTARETAVLKFITDYRAQHNHSPTLREIAEGVGRAKGTVNEQVDALIAKGRLRHWVNRKSGIEPVHAPPPPRTRVAELESLLLEIDWQGGRRMELDVTIGSDYPVVGGPLDGQTRPVEFVGGRPVTEILSRGYLYRFDESRMEWIIVRPAAREVAA